MSLDWGFVSIQLSLTPVEAARLDVSESFLVDAEAREAATFITSYRNETGKTPPKSLVVEKFPAFQFDDSIDPRWLYGELRERRARNILADGLKVAVADLRDGEPNDVLETLDRIQRDVMAVQQRVAVQDLQAVGDRLKTFYEDIKAGKMGIEFPWESVNLMTRGMWPETVTFFAARPSVGKTFLAIIIARHAYMNGHRVLVISPEMSAMEIGERFFSIEAAVPYSDVVSGSLSQVRGEDGLSVEDRYFRSLSTPSGKVEGPFVMDDEDRLTPSAMEAAISSLQPDLIAVDAAYLLRVGKGSRYERIIDVVEWLRHVAKAYHVPVLATSQLNKEAEKKGKGGAMATVAMTDTINWDAHNLFALKQTPEMREDGRLSIIPVKVRRMARMHGKTEISIHWDMDRMDFEEVADAAGEFEDRGHEDFSEKDMPF